METEPGKNLTVLLQKNVLQTVQTKNFKHKFKGLDEICNSSMSNVTLVILYLCYLNKIRQKSCWIIAPSFSLSKSVCRSNPQIRKEGGMESANREPGALAAAVKQI